MTSNKGAASVAPISKQKKIAIVCGAPTSEHLAPFDDESWEIWVLANRLDRHKDRRITRVFEIHDDLSEHGDPVRYAQWVVDQGYPVIAGEGFPVKADNVTVFPFEKSKALFGSTYLTSSSAYMMAYAILEGATHIGVYGVDMAVDDHEYFWQRPCMEAWVGFAKGKGIDVMVHKTSPLFNSDYVEGKGCGGKPDFSVPPFTQAEFLAMAADHQQKMDDIQEQINALTLKMNAHGGAKQAYERLAKVARGVEAGQKLESLRQNVVVK